MEDTKATPAADTAAPRPISEESITTITAADAVTTTTAVSENLIIANVGGKYKRFAKVEHVPASCRTYTSKAELKGQLKKQLETILAYVTGEEMKPAKNQEEAADNLWNAFGKLPIYDPVKDAPETQERRAAGKKKEVSGTPAPAGDTPKKTYEKKREESKYHIKPMTEKSKKLVSELAPQAQSVVEIIHTDGKQVYTEAELKSLMDANRDKLRTRQTAWRIFQYYRSDLVAADVLTQQ